MYIVECRGKGIKVVRKSGIVEDDVDEVITNMSLLVSISHVVFAICWHHSRNMEDKLHAAVAPTVRELAIRISLSVQTASIEFSAFKATKSAKVVDKRCVRWRANVIHEDVFFICLTFANIYHAQFVAINRGNTIKRSNGATCHVVVG